MNDLRSRVAAFLSGPYILGTESRVIRRYFVGDLAGDPEALTQVSHCLQAARTEAAKFEGETSGPGRDVRYCYGRMAELLTDIQTELLVRQ
jgi:hypothetical protein